jgi:hypothetical protein
MRPIAKRASCKSRRYVGLSIVAHASDLDCGGKVLRDAAFSLRIEDKAASRSTLPPQSKRVRPHSQALRE